MTITNYYYSGQGSLWLASRNVDGVPIGFRRVGNVPELSLDITTSVVEHTESESGERGIDLVLTTEKKGNFTFKLENLDLYNLALGLYGTRAAVSAGSVVSEAVKFFHGKKSILAYPNVSNVVVTGKSAGTDYTLDAKTGALTALSTGTIADEATINVSYDYGVSTKLDAFTQIVAPERWLRFNGLNTVDGSHVIIDIFRAKFEPLTGYGLISDEVAAVDMKGQILADTLRLTGSKFFRQWNIAAV